MCPQASYTDLRSWLQAVTRGTVSLSPTLLIVFLISSEQLNTLSLILSPPVSPAVTLPTSLLAMASMDLLELVARSTGPRSATPPGL